MKLTALSISGLRGTDRTIDLAPVTVWTGPNGGGKTSAVGAIAYALTGRFPGIIGEHAEDLLSLATERGVGFNVELQGATATGVEIWISRGIDREGVNFLKVDDGRSQSRGISSAKTMLAALTGEVQWFIDAFDTEKSVWRLSTEKRKEWALELCSGASGWPKERLIAELGPPSDFWDPNVMSDAARCLDKNLSTITDRIRATQKLVREARVIADGVSVETDIAIKLVRAEQVYEEARAESSRIDKLVEATKQAQVSIDKTRRDRQSIGQQVEMARQTVHNLAPPRPPQQPPRLHELEQLESELFTLELETEDAQSATDRISAQRDQAAEYLSRYQTDLLTAQQTQSCSHCETHNPPLGPFLQRVDSARKRLNDLTANLAGVGVRSQTAARREAAVRADVDALKLAASDYQRVHGIFAASMRQFESTWTTALTSLSTLETNLAALPQERTDVSLSKLEAELTSARAKEFQCKTELNLVRGAVGVAKERDGQLRASREATERLEQLKSFQERLREVRDRMLDDAVDPLRAALAQLDALAHKGGHWDIRREGRELEIGWSDRRTFLPAPSLSTGEKYRATVALLVARQMVRREPFAGLFLDNFECIYPTAERDRMIEALVTVASSGFVDNVFMAGACESPDIVGTRSYHQV